MTENQRAEKKKTAFHVLNIVYIQWVVLARYTRESEKFYAIRIFFIDFFLKFNLSACFFIALVISKMLLNILVW